MSAHVEWVSAPGAEVGIIDPHEEWTDSFGQRIEPGKIGLCLGGDDLVVIEGTKAELWAFSQRLARTVKEADSGPCAPCADGEHATVEDEVCLCCRRIVLEKED